MPIASVAAPRMAMREVIWIPTICAILTIRTTLRTIEVKLIANTSVAPAVPRTHSSDEQPVRYLIGFPNFLMMRLISFNAYAPIRFCALMERFEVDSRSPMMMMFSSLN